mmetsp:Transcript_33346/g.83053  ORF Transcript_33346/g.83053 Transcript_33346/m.83053 type:complete len:274 (-) Transcript_33346:1748-2569(-)
MGPLSAPSLQLRFDISSTGARSAQEEFESSKSEKSSVSHHQAVGLRTRPLMRPLEATSVHRGGGRYINSSARDVPTSKCVSVTAKHTTGDGAGSYATIGARSKRRQTVSCPSSNPHTRPAPHGVRPSALKPASALAHDHRCKPLIENTCRRLPAVPEKITCPESARSSCSTEAPLGSLSTRTRSPSRRVCRATVPSREPLAASRMTELMATHSTASEWPRSTWVGYFETFCIPPTFELVCHSIAVASIEPLISQRPHDETATEVTSSEWQSRR